MMEENFEEKLLKVDIIEIYDDVAAIDLTMDQIIELCRNLPCRVDLKLGNVVYAVEKKYKDKLAKYKGSKRLKWLNVNLRSIVPNPEEKFLKWKQKHDQNTKRIWLTRKLNAIDLIPSEPLLFSSEAVGDLCEIREKTTSIQRNQNKSRLSIRKDLMPDTSNCSTCGNTSSESVQTVIASQPKNTQESSFMLSFRDVSRSTSSSSSGQLPSLVMEDGSTFNPSEEQSLPHTNKKIVRPLPPGKGIHIATGESQEEAYRTFYQDMQVTSTQEFG